MSLRLATLLTMLSGFISLSYEILWIRAFSFAVAGAAFGFALLLGAYLLGIAIGSYLVRDIGVGDRQVTGDGYRTLAIFIACSNIGGVLVVPLMAHIAAAGIHPGVGLTPVIIVSGALGAQLPLISHYCISPDTRAGENISYIYVANIIGSVLGSLLTGFVLFEIWTMATITAVLGALGMIVAFAVFASGGVKRKNMLRSLALTLAFIGAIVMSVPPLFTHLWERLQFKENYESSEPFKHVVENRSGVITVGQDDVVYGGGVYDGQFSLDLVEDTNMIVRSYSLGLFHPNPRRVLVVGLASGSWASILANQPGVEEVTIVEINPGYLELIKQYEPHRKLFDDAHVEIVIDDARRWLRRNPERIFDAIVVNTTFHWRGNASNLLSMEWMSFISNHLSDDGVYIFNTTMSERAARTALDSFSHCMMIINCMVCSQAPLDYNPERWLEQLADFSLWGTPVLDLEQAADREKLETLKTFSILVDERPKDRRFNISTQKYLEDLTVSVEPITDDNMGEEWPNFLK